MKRLLQTEELRKILESSGHPLLIDVRLNQDFQAAHIPDATNNCVFEVAFHERLIAAAPDRTQPVIVYGAEAGSYESQMAAEKLSRSGYAEIYEYRDGLAGWRSSGAQITQGEPRPPEPVIPDGVRSVDLAESFIEWTGRNLLNKHHGRIELSSGQLEFVNGQLRGGRFTIDMNKMFCSDLAGKEPHDVLIDHLRGDDFFDVERFPEASFVIHAVRTINDATIGQTNLEISGDLTLKGVSGPLTFRAAAGVTSEGKAAAQAVLSFDRTRWNVVYGSGRLFHGLGMHLVNDLIDLEIKIVAQ